MQSILLMSARGYDDKSRADAEHPPALCALVLSGGYEQENSDNANG